MTQFYANQLSNANKTITSLHKEVSRLHRGNQSQLNQAQEKITKQKLENQGLKSQIKTLKSKIELMQM
jgi:peptidoglycan hydrolase CwlO-like protein